MKLIKEIEIRYFRSIYYLKIKNIEDCLVFSGKNDSGKSNILKALNLFFNNDTDWNTEIDFYSDFNYYRLSQVREESVKGKQFIQIAITFRRGNTYQNTLPEIFTIRKQWDRYSKLPKVSDNLENLLAKGKIKSKKINIIRRSLTGYMNRINFEYVPAIKDNKLFNHVLSLLQKDIISISLKKGQKIDEDIQTVSGKFQTNVEDLAEEFKKSTNINTRIGLPVNPSELFQVLNVSTVYGEKDNYSIPINNRGDGIRLRYLPSLYHFLAQHHSGYYIVGYEEPENSMEYNLSTQMAKDFQLIYSKKSQILITSHSSAFFFNYSGNSSLYRVFKEEDITKALKLEISEDSLQLEDDTVPDFKLREEIGLTSLQKIFHKQYERKLKELTSKVEQIEILKQKVAEADKPVLFTEGKTDVFILKTAWERLYNIPCPFEIFSSETTTIDGGDGGYSALNRKLESVREDEKLQIGLYDNDEAGCIKGFQKLNKNFLNFNSDKYIKLHKNKRAIAILLPACKGLELFEKFKNLQIEFYFELSDLNKEIGGKRLIIEPFQQKIQFHGEEIETATKHDLHLSKINTDSKKHFAEKVVPTFNKESFKNFEKLFDSITDLINRFDK